ncbi:aminotransferase class IV [Thermoanaerobacter kivui]|uniref:Aminotransferase class IV n=1 Tax=Thermoanaerobacter kivui TaxID=2325 RepID=A0A097ATH1_THEKI|nr:aminotransferase class IV [Thermoanaerobacter kivui]AIS53106.1 aminotransferase class IV [Thermoanaerobacter kivui]
MSFYYSKFGLVPFETIYYEDGDAYFLYEHFKRLKRGFFVLKTSFELQYEDFRSQIIRYILNNGSKFGGISTFFDGQKLLIEKKEISYSRNLYEKGLDIVVSKVFKDSKNILNYIKTFNMGLNYIEDKRAKEKGYDTCLFLNQRGFICEAAFANIFFRKGNLILTPRLSSGILPGVTRKKVIEKAVTLGYEVKKCYLKLEDVAEMEESFVTSSIGGVFPIRRIENVHFESREFAEKVNACEYFKRPWNF